MDKKDFYVMPNYYETRIDLEKWIPDEEKDSNKILQDMYDYYKGTLDLCGAGEEATQALEQYLKVKSNGLIKEKERVQSYFLDIYWAVDGKIEEYYQNSPELIKLINLTILKEN